MQSRWRDVDAAAVIDRYAAEYGENLALRTYSSRLIGTEPSLVLHGGGNTSVKDRETDVFGTQRDALFVKASGHDLACIEPAGHVALQMEGCLALGALSELSDEIMLAELRKLLFVQRAPTPSIETLVHALLPARFIDHSHPDVVLTLTNQPDGDSIVQEALGDDVTVLPYVPPGFALAKAAAAAYESNPRACALIWVCHGIVTWGESARESYERMIELVSRAETYIERRASRVTVTAASRPSPETVDARLARVAPVVRGLLAEKSGDPDRPYRRVVMRPLATRETLEALAAENARELLVSPPLTGDHFVRTKPLPAWVESPDYDDEARLKVQILATIESYQEWYRAYLARHQSAIPDGVEAFDPLPRVVLMPGLGALCVGRDAASAGIVRDITRQTLVAKMQIAALGATYRGLEEEHCFDLEYRAVQHAKLMRAIEFVPLAEAVPPPPLTGEVALVTGAAGAIGSGICEGLLQAGAHVAVTDIAGDALDGLVNDLVASYPQRVMGIALDVTDPQSVAAGFAAASRAWGGVDLVVINAGLAHVALLEDLQLEAFRRLERVNTEGTLLPLAEASRHFKRQATGGDVVLVSTKNVFAPGASFGAYSATKAAAHQLARIASLELASADVRVNMVAPDAVFSYGDRKSGLWAAVGPGRMKARGLTEDGLEEYYRKRNLLQVKVTARHVANAVLFFATRQTPTTGATLPVDGGLPDATPR